MENKKQTAVEWLIEIYLTTGIDRNVHFHQAKAMEKEQIIDAYKQCENSHISWECDGSEEYYTSTYE
jgi:hypothetical protein